jgi:hypothetical protein
MSSLWAEAGFGTFTVMTEIHPGKVFYHLVA